MKHLKRRLTAAILSVLLATSSFTAAPISVTAATSEETEADEGIGANETDGANDEVGVAENDSVGAAPTRGTTGDCTWEIDEEGTLTISGNGRMKEYRYLDDDLRPEWYDWSEKIKSVIISNGVTYISKAAFCFCTGLTSITIPDSVTSIGYHAFSGCTGLTNINIPDSVTYISDAAFSGCIGLTSIDFPDSVTYLSGLDYCTGLTSVTIPDSVTTIGYNAFSGCTGLTNIDIPDSVTSISDAAFMECTGLTSINIPNSVTTIGSSAFYGCTGLINIDIPDSVTNIGGDAFTDTAWYNAQPNGLVYAGKVAYSYKGEMPYDTSIIIKDGTKGIAGYAFSYCDNLTSVTIPDSVKNIGMAAFYRCFGLNDVYINDIKAWCEISFYEPNVEYSGNPLRYAKNLYVNNEPVSNLIIPNNVTYIGTAAFYGFTGLKSVTIPDTVSTIGICAFTACYNLETVSIGENVREIKNAAFSSCESLKTVVIPDNVRSIGRAAFFRCSSLDSLSIGLYLNDVGDGVFSGCRNINSITIHEDNPYFLYKDGILYNKLREELVWCNCNDVNDTSIIIPEIIPGTEGLMNKRVKKIKDDAFADVYLEEIYIDKSIESIGYDTFGLNHDRIDIYYNGTKEQWEEIDGTEYIDYDYVTMHFLDSEPIHGNLYESEEVDGIIKTKAIDGIETELNESWFEDNSYYNHDLARLCSEMVAMGYHAESDKKVIDLEKSLSDLGFSNLEHCNDTRRDEEDYFIASKSIKKAGEDYNLVFCGCIGSNGKQWNSDFDPKGRESSSMWWMNPVEEDFENHIGFIDARKYVYNKLSDYLKRKNYNKEKTVLLLTGHSRGAAAANLLAAKLIDDNDIVSPDNLFTYTFACPNGTCSMKRLVDYDKYDRIFNIIFPTDFVTKVFPSKWTYGRYGTTYTLPTKTNDVSYDKYKERMLDYYEKLNGSRNFSDYDNGEEEVWSIINEVQSRVGNLNNYYYYYFSFYISETYIGYANVVKETPYMFFQKGLCPVVNGEGTPTALKELIPALTMPGSLYFNIAKFFLVNAFEKTDYSILNEIGEKYDFKPRFHDAHKMETYCAFMLAMESDQVTLNRKIYKNTLNCPVDIEITEKESGEVVGRIVDNTVDEEIAAKPNSVVMTVDGDEKEFWLPGNGEYDVRLIGNDNGVMDYTVREIDPDTGETNRVNYYNVPVEKDKAYTDFFTSEKAFVITAENGSELTPDEAFNSENEVTYSVTVTAEGSGTASDSLTVTSGDYVTLTASPVESEFLGWYQNDTLVSTDLEYRFRPTEDISLTAKFTGEDLKPVEFGDVDVDGEVTISDATQIQMYLAELVELEDVQVLLSDYNLDGSVDISDATQIQLKLAELI